MGEEVLTVFCLTYNHAPYIKDALDGFLKQKTTFKYNVFVFDDASTDGTSEILKLYQKKYPQIFDIYISPRNIYKASNRKEIMNSLYKKHLTGKYIALCEGDDYWISTDKIQIQVEYMEKHPECSMTAHAALWIDCSYNTEKVYSPYSMSKRITSEEIIMQENGNLPTASLVVKRDLFFKEDDYPECDVEDWPMQLYAICKGDIYYFNQVMSAYRYMHPGSWSTNIGADLEKLMLHNYKMVDFLEKYDVFSKARFHESVQKKKLDYLYGNVWNYIAMDCEEYCKICVSLDIDSAGIYKEYINRQCAIFKIINGIYVLTESERKKILSFRYVVIMGAGEYAGYLKNMLNNNAIGYMGHVVSKIEKKEKNMEQLWEVDSYPYDPDETLVLIGIHQKHERQVRESLGQNGFTNILTPVWFG